MARAATGQAGSGTTDAAKTARIGSPVRDGKFEFLVSGVDCGRDRLGEAYLNTTAQGQFCLVSMRITNIGDEPQTMFSDNQKLFDAAGREYAADTEAAFYLDEASQTLWEEINPGNTVKGVVVFDVPKKTTPTRLRLHDSAFSGGVVIEL